MTIEKLRPDTMPPAHGYPQAVAATGSRMVFTSGQVGMGLDEKMVAGGENYSALMERAVLNGYAAVTAAGGKPSDVVRLMIYIVDPTPEKLEQVYAGYGEAMQTLQARPSAMTLIGVTALSDPGYFVEIDITAVID